MNRRRTDPSGKPVVAVRLDGRDKLPSQNPLAVKLGAISRAAESRPAREPSRDVIDRANRSQAMEAREMRMTTPRAAVKKPTATAAEAAAIDRANRAQAREARGNDGFRDSTRMRYMQGGDEYAKGGSVKGAAKVAKVMGEFKRGELHSGSKKGPKVTSEKQAKAIAMSEARAAGAKMPAPKKRGVPVASREPMIKAKGGLCTTMKR
jgi:hypothetical protein